jgi:hypothetical protein
MTSNDEETLALFLGRWIGETQGWEMPAHIWEISRQGAYLRLATRWEGETQTGDFYAQIVPGQPAFQISSLSHGKAILIDKQHFVIPGWCTNDTRNNQGPSYDVIFSRPGIAELTAREAYLKYLQQQKA